MNILDYTMFGQAMIKILSRKDNVEIKYGAEVSGYEVDKNTKYVTSLSTSTGEKIPCNIVINCMGP